MSKELIVVDNNNLQLVDQGNEAELHRRFKEAEEDLKNCLEYKILEEIKKEYEEFIKKKTNFMDNSLKIMQNNKVNELEVGNYIFKVKKGKKSVASDIVDETLIPEKYKKITTTVVKADILKDLKEGIFIPGAELKENEGVETLVVELKEVSKLDIKTLKLK